MRRWQYERIIWDIEREWTELSEKEAARLEKAERYAAEMDEALADAGIKFGFIERICHIIYIERLARKVRKLLNNGRRCIMHIAGQLSRGTSTGCQRKSQDKICRNRALKMHKYSYMQY